MSINRWMSKEVVVHIQSGILFSYEKECIWFSSNEMDEPGTYYTEWSKKERERQILYINTYIWNLEKQYWKPNILGSKGDTGIKNRILDSVGEGKGWFKRIALKHLHYHMWNRWPVQVWCMKQGTQSRCTGTTQRDGMGRGGGRGVQDGRHMYTRGWFMLMYGKTHHNTGK